MSKKIRDGLFILFIVLFVILTVITSIYASGYKFNLSWPLKFNRLLQKTGMLAAATKPNRAVIYLDGKPQQDLSFNPFKKDYLTTPNKVKNILPGRYELSLELEGYWPYRQTINVYSGETTFVEDVILFKESSPLLVTASPETNLLISTDFRYLYTQTTAEIINLKTEESRQLFNNDTGENDILIKAANTDVSPPGQWLKNNKFFKDGIIFDPLKDSNDDNYTSIIGASASDWRYEESGGLLYYRNNSGLSRFAVANQATDLILPDGNYPDYQARGERLFFIIKDQAPKLVAFSLKDRKNEAEWTLPNSGQYVFVNNIPGYLSLYDAENKTLYFFQEDDIKAGPITINHINSWEAIGDDQLLYSNGTEIQIFNLKNGRSELITRRSEQIIDLIWHALENYLIFTTPETINIFDFKNGHTTSLLKTDRLASPVLDEKNNNLYFWAAINGTEGIYKINLR